MLNKTARASFILFSVSLFIACNDNEANHVKNEASQVKHERPEDPSGKVVSANDMRDRMLGIWAFTGDENATYKYLLTNDSLHIKFADYTGNYLAKMKGPDILILVGSEEQVYYRFKK